MKTEEKTVAGFRVLVFEELSSTQDVSLELAESSDPENVVIQARSQVGGRGRCRDRKWFSPRGGLWFSVILRLPVDLNSIAWLPLLPAVSSAEAIRKGTGLDVELKWPNDLTLRDRKIGGVMADSKTNVEQLVYAVLGIGLNVNIPRSRFPEELANRATSVQIEKGSAVPMEDLFKRILEQIRIDLDALESGQKSLLRSKYLDLSYTIGRRVRVYSGYEEIEGQAVDITEDGALVLETRSKMMQIHTCDRLVHVQN